MPPSTSHLDGARSVDFLARNGIAGGIDAGSRRQLWSASAAASARGRAKAVSNSSTEAATAAGSAASETLCRAHSTISPCSAPRSRNAGDDGVPPILAKGVRFAAILAISARGIGKGAGQAGIPAAQLDHRVVVASGGGGSGVAASRVQRLIPIGCRDRPPNLNRMGHVLALSATSGVELTRRWLIKNLRDTVLKRPRRGSASADGRAASPALRPLSAARPSTLFALHRCCSKPARSATRTAPTVRQCRQDHAPRAPTAADRAAAPG